jgi:hypothetical protein
MEASRNTFILLGARRTRGLRVYFCAWRKGSPRDLIPRLTNEKFYPNRERVNTIGFVSNGRFFVMGGVGKGFNISNDIYDPKARKWVLVPKMW